MPASDLERSKDRKEPARDAEQDPDSDGMS
jgi:hypothetical protein